MTFPCFTFSSLIFTNYISIYLSNFDLVSNFKNYYYFLHFVVLCDKCVEYSKLYLSNVFYHVIWKNKFKELLGKNIYIIITFKEKYPFCRIKLKHVSSFPIHELQLCRLEPNCDEFIRHVVTIYSGVYMNVNKMLKGQEVDVIMQLAFHLT